MSKIKTKLEEARKIHQEIEEYQSRHAATFDLVLAELEKIGVTIVNEVLYPSDLTVSLSGDKHKLAATIGMLRRNGFNSDKRPQKGELQYSANWRNDSGACLYIIFTGTSCRRVKVGTKMVEQDVYETVCDELVLDTEPETAAA